MTSTTKIPSFASVSSSDLFDFLSAIIWFALETKDSADIEKAKTLLLQYNSFIPQYLKSRFIQDIEYDLQTKKFGKIEAETLEYIVKRLS